MLSIYLHIGDIVLENGWDVDLWDANVRTITKSSICVVSKDVVSSAGGWIRSRMLVPLYEEIGAKEGC